MDISAPLLTLLALLPIVGGLIGLIIRGRNAKLLALAVSVATLIFGVVVFVLSANNPLTEQLSWIPAIGAYYALSLDGMGRAMVLLTVILVPIVLLAEWQNMDGSADNPARWSGHVFASCALLLEGFGLYVFMAADVLLFYIFFEATLIPMFFMIFGWGGAKRGKAALKFLLYSLAGGLVMLFAVIGVYVATEATGTPSFLISQVADANITGSVGRLLFAGFFFAFAVKAPMVPVHAWLPDSAEQALPGATTLLVGVLDKIGTFGMIRLCLTLFPEATIWATPLVVVLAVLSVLYGAFMAISSKNLLRLVAYTSVSHFGFMVLGVFAFTTAAFNGTMFYMLAHGFSSAAMFLAVGFLVNRRGSALIADFGGLQSQTPVLAAVFLVSGLATLGLPGTANFAGEFSIMAGAWPRQLIAVIFAVFGTVLAALYVLWAYQRVFTGELNPELAKTPDLNLTEKLIVGPLVALMLIFGFVPQLMMNVVNPTAQAAMTSLDMTDPEPMGGN